MTWHLTGSLLEDYIDGELAETEVTRVTEHLKTCPECRAEFDSGRRLKIVLSQQRLPDPGPDYWPEVTSLVLARTVESGATQFVERPAAERQHADVRRTFVRSLVSLAASLVLLVSALVVGSNHLRERAQTAPEKRPVYVAASIRALIGPDNYVVITPKEKVTIARGVSALGAPGLLGRVSALSQLLTFE